MKAAAALHLQITQLKDELRYSPRVREWTARFMVWRSRLAGGPARLALLCRALSLCDAAEAWRPVLAELREAAHGTTAEDWKAALLHGSRLPAIVRQSPALTRTVILKAPGENGEKGVLLHYFEYNLARVLMGLSAEDLEWLADRFEIILAASWTPTDYTQLGLAAATLPHGLWIQPATHGERDRLTAFHPNIRCLPGLACDWVDPVFYQPRPWADRAVDILMVANWGAFKRHWEFFKALRDMPADLKVVLVGQNEGGNTRDTIRQLADDLEVPQKLDIRGSIPIQEVTKLQCDSKVSMVISRREGGCVAMVESLFAGCGIAMRQGASIGSAAHVNAQTGALLRPDHLAEDLMALLERGPSLKSSAWAIAHVSCHQTLKALEETLADHARRECRPWTQGLAQPHWRPHPVLANQDDRVRLAPVYQALHARFPVLFPAELMSLSSG